MKLKKLIPEGKADKVSDVIKEMYPYVAEIKVVRMHVYGDHKFNPAYKESKYTIRLNKIGEFSRDVGIGYVIELKRTVQVLWKGKVPIQLNTEKARWEVIKYKFIK